MRINFSEFPVTIRAANILGDASYACLLDSRRFDLNRANSCHVEFGLPGKGVDAVLFLIDIRQLRVAVAEHFPVAQKRIT